MSDSVGLVTETVASREWLSLGPAEDVAPSPPTRGKLRRSLGQIGGFSGMPVAERDGALIGGVTEFHVIRAIRRGKAPEETTVEEIMTDHVISVDVEASTGKSGNP